jgi:hypothetical protein
MYGHSALQFVVPISFTMCQSLYTASIAAKDKEDELKAKKIAVGGTMVVFLATHEANSKEDHN